MESVESFHGERINLPLKLQTYEEMRRLHAVVDPAKLPSVPDSMYHAHLPILWIEGFDLVTVWVDAVAVGTTLTAADATWHESRG